MAVAVVMGASFSTGCISTISEKDVKQTVATVNISKDENFVKQFGDYASAVTDEVFSKRDLIIYYFNGGRRYNTDYGYSMADTIEAIKDTLVREAIMTQYATVELLKYKVEEAEGDEKLSLDTFKSKQTVKEKYEYLLGGEESEGVKRAEYQLKYMINSALDSYEQRKLDEVKGYEGSGSRSTPSGIDTLKEDYFPEDYNIYTGYEGYLLADAGEDYEPLEGTNRNTRREAFSEFIGFLKSSFYITEEDSKLTDVLSISYVQDEYVNYLQNEIVEAYNEVFEQEQRDKINTVENGIYTYIQDKYNGLEDGGLTAQQQQYSNPNNTTAFETAMGSMSDTSFILYSPATTEYSENIDGTYGTFGYVYNILLPFSSAQETTLKTYQSYQSSGRIDDNVYFRDRNQLLKGITTTDQREAWFNGENQYAFNVAEYNKDKDEADKLAYYNGGNSERNYLFFENNLTQGNKYEKLQKYAGLYSYNGKVTENKNGSYKLIPNKLDIDDMLEEFAAYINFVMGGDGNVAYNAGDKLDASATDFLSYYDQTKFTKGDGKEIDYSKLVYATGKVTFANQSREDMFVADSDRYKAMSAVNELQYAYTTDTGVLSQYIGYTVSAYDTSYIKEFEYAAQQALRMGAGAFKVCAGDYGWHLIYVTETFDFAGGEVYKPVFNQTRIETEGTFENRFYNWYKDSSLTNEVSLKRAEVLKQFNTEATVKVNTKAYKDMSELG